MRHKPDFIIIGAMKCATSTLHDQLALQKKIFMSTPKEPNFFGDDKTYAKGEVWYESLFEKSKPYQLCGESSTHYTKLPTFPNAVTRIKTFHPEMRFIYVMRHPINRLISHYIHEWTQGVISCDIDKALQKFPELISYSKYSMQITPYLNTFGASSILPLFLERLQINPLNELKTIFNFLKVNEEPCWEDNLRSNVSSERLRICGWRDSMVNNSLLKIIRRSLVPQKMRNKIKSIWAMKERPTLSLDSLRYVEEIFDQDLKVLGKLLDIKLTCQVFHESVTSSAAHTWKNN